MRARLLGGRITTAPATAAPVDAATLTRQYNDATRMSQRAEYAEAAHLLRHVVEGRTRVLGADHPATEATRNVLRSFEH